MSHTAYDVLQQPLRAAAAVAGCGLAGLRTRLIAHLSPVGQTFGAGPLWYLTMLSCGSTHAIAIQAGLSLYPRGARRFNKAAAPETISADRPEVALLILTDPAAVKWPREVPFALLVVAPRGPHCSYAQA